MAVSRAQGAIARVIRACLAGHRVAFATATEWVDRLGAAHNAGRLHDDYVGSLRYVRHDQLL